MSYLHTLLFGYAPYVALTVFLAGSLIRFDREQYTWRSGSSQMLRKQSLQLGSNLFHVGILLLFMGHFFGLLTPPEVYHAFGLSVGAKQWLAIIAGSVFGTVCFIGLTLLLHRRLTDARIRKTSSPMDLVILGVLWVQLVLGLATIPASIAHSDGGTMLALADWAQRIVTFRAGAAEAVADVGLVYKLHLVLGMVMVLLFPFSRLVHIWSAPVWYLGRRYQVVRTRFRHG
ncbi:nitrate reductase gamma subunit [Azospirillum fermentarium]|uniref:respiratory nitrate reductase subunit gamma n=1 Tax=Azospirillum fermentarium TaxID=1233114 RepID=UPI0022274D74|nr:respiratory nitrate reductase subunit gamma [Azospirillum fermentarium]MCW2248989.1 nitrate reductase gamma subunit [Azospirillum fermentarium]